MSTLKHCDNCGQQTKPVPNGDYGGVWFSGWHGTIKLMKINEHHGTFDLCSLECMKVFVAEKLETHVKKG